MRVLVGQILIQNYLCQFNKADTVFNRVYYNIYSNVA